MPRKDADYIEYMKDYIDEVLDKIVCIFCGEKQELYNNFCTKCGGILR